MVSQCLSQIKNCNMANTLKPHQNNCQTSHTSTCQLHTVMHDSIYSMQPCLWENLSVFHKPLIDHLDSTQHTITIAARYYWVGGCIEQTGLLFCTLDSEIFNDESHPLHCKHLRYINPDHIEPLKAMSYYLTYVSKDLYYGTYLSKFSCHCLVLL